MSVHRRWFVPEVVQTSGMDCGPAALKALAGGFGIHVSYGRLREACHTDVDGTSIDTLEDLARALGIDAEQVMVPLDHVLLDTAAALPAIAVAQTAAGAAHFIVIWQKVGPWVQVMDPARGRIWLSRTALLDSLFRHTLVVKAEDWRAWAGSNDFCHPLVERLVLAGLSRSAATARVEHAAADTSWRGLATLDAATRMLAELRRTGALSGSRARHAIAGVLDDDESARSIPDHYWSVRPVAAPAAIEQLRLRGAVLVRGRGRLAARTDLKETTESPEIAAALAEPAARPIREMAATLRGTGAVAPVAVACAIAAAAFGVIVEALLLRSIVDVSVVLPLPLQGLAAGAVLVLFAFALLALEGVLAAAERRAGSHLEGRLRIAFFEKIAQLPDSYFQSRPMADMLERSHGLHLLRTLPQLAIRVVRVGAELAVTTAAIMWLDPRVALIALVAGIFAAVIPIAGNVFIAPRDLKVRTHAGALAKFQLDALLGRTAIEAHRADAVIESEHDQRLAEWAKSSMSLQRASVAVEGVQTLIGFGLAGWVLFTHFAGGVNGAMLLMAYWVLNVPALGYELALIAREYPAHRNTVLRLLEPLRAPSETRRNEHAGRPAAATPGVSLEFQQVSVRAAGNQVLERVSIAVRPGTHVAIVGASGAGKSTLVGLLLGWYRAHSGTIRVDGDLLTAERVEQLRAETAWVDPSVQIWNASLLENLLYGSGASPQDVAPVLDAAALVGVIAKLPSGMATPLGESGALLSAGEGQRVRLGRAMMRDKPRLVILDEPFLGLERDRRRSLLAHARQRWAGATMLYVTHDVSETRAFDRVLVIEHGRVAEDGSPVQLAQVPSSRYRRLLQSQETVHARLNSGEWRRIRLENGRITSDHAAAIEQRA